MRMNYQDMIDELHKLKLSNSLVIVEGKKDKRALELFDIKNIKVLKKALYLEIEEIEKKNEKVIILTDLDKKGKKLYATIYSELQKRGVKVNNNFREYLFKHTKLTQIEGLSNYIKNNCR